MDLFFNVFMSGKGFKSTKNPNEQIPSEFYWTNDFINKLTYKILKR